MTVAVIKKNRKIWVLLALVLLVVPNIFVSASVQKSRGGDFRGFLVAGDRFINGTFLYENSAVASGVTWPPFFAALIVPFTVVSKVSLPLSQVAWYCVNTTLFFLALGLWSAAFRGKPFGWFNETKGETFYALPVFLPIVFVVGPFIINVLALQVNPILFFVVAGGIYHIGRERPVRAGIWLGLAGAIKAFPVFLMVFLIYRKNIRAALAMAISGFAFTVLPIFRYGFHDFVENFRAWLGISLTGGYPFGGLNQSVYAMAARFVSGDAVQLLTTRLPAPLPHDPAAIAATWIYRLSLLGLIGVFIWLVRHKRFRSLGVEAAFFITLMTVFSPIAWRHYFVLMVPAWMVLTDVWLGKKDKILGWLTIGSGVLITGGYIIGTLSRPVRSVLMNICSHVTIGALMILAGLLYCVYKKYGDQSRETSI